MAVGYRVGEPQETNAKKLIEFEVVESGNVPMLDYLAAALNCEPTLESIKNAIDRQFGADAIGMWLCDSPEWAVERYGPGEAYSVDIPEDAIVGTDLGSDGKLWIWRKEETPKASPVTVFVEIRMLKGVPAIIGSDLKVYGPFTAGKVYALPKANARAFLKMKAAVATRKEAEKPTLKEMFKGEVLDPYIEAARVRPLVETDEEKVITQTVENCEYWASNICKRETLEKYCIEKRGVPNPGEILDDLIRRGVVYTPKPGYVGLTEPEKYGLPPIERAPDVEAMKKRLLERIKVAKEGVAEEK